MDTKELVANARRSAYGLGQSGMTGTEQTITALCDAVDAMAWTNATLLQSLTDEQNAHKLTTEALTKAIRDGDKAEQYRVGRDKARAEVRELEKDRERLNFIERNGRGGLDRVVYEGYGDQSLREYLDEACQA